MPEADPWLGGRLSLRQPPRGAHRAGTDAALLGRLLRPGAGAVVCDVGAGAGAVGLAVAVLSPDCRVILIERAPDLVALARRNAEANGLGDRVAAIEADVLAPEAARHAAGLAPRSADIVLTNPPFFEEGRHRPSPVPGKAAAHTLATGAFDGWIRACLDLLKPGGTLGLIHRADALPDCLAALRGRFGSISVRPVHAAAGRPAIRVLMTAVKGSRGPFVLRPPLVLCGAGGHASAESDALHRGEPWDGAGA